MFVVDTNVLVDAFDASARYHGVCRALLERWRRQAGAWHVTWSVLYEFMRVMTHRARPRPLTQEQVIDAVDALLASPGLSVLTETERHAAVLRELLGATSEVSGDFMHDAHVVALMYEHGVARIYTRDVALHRFQGIEIIDPSRSSLPSGTAEPVARYRPRRRRLRG